MVALRNLFARHDTDVGLYYLRRGATVSAVERAKYLLETYPPSEYQNDAVALLAAAATGLRNETLATDAERVVPEHDPTPQERTGTWPDYPGQIRTIHQCKGRNAA